jgi:hypothetical protein
MPPFLIAVIFLYFKWWRDIEVWSKRTWLSFITWWLFATFMIFSIHMKWRKDKAICGPNGWHLKHLGYNASCIAIIQEFDQVHIGKIWWFGISSGHHNLNPWMIYIWTFYLPFKVKLQDLIFFFGFKFLHQGFRV